MGRQKVVCREYKVMLRPDRFARDEKKVLEPAEAFWRDLSQRIADAGVTKGELGQLKARRLIKFYDTPKQLLNKASYIFRERHSLDGGNREVTLKFRHPDRYVAQNRNMEARSSEDARTKFEEDIKAPFVSLYSFSTTLPIGENKNLNLLRDVTRLFPGIVGSMAEFIEDAALIAVNSFTARELVLCGASLQIGKSAKEEAECALIIWYDHDRHKGKPVAVEFSYRYGDKDEDYDGTKAQYGFDVFKVLQTKLSKWVDPKAGTKTAFVYG